MVRHDAVKTSLNENICSKMKGDDRYNDIVANIIAGPQCAMRWSSFLGCRSHVNGSQDQLCISSRCHIIDA